MKPTELDGLIKQLRHVLDDLQSPSAAIKNRLTELAKVAQAIKRKFLAPPDQGTKPSPGPAVDHLAELNKRLGIVRDRIKAVAAGRHTGFYLYGRAGTSKTHTVVKTLESLGAPFVYQNAHLTPLGVFTLLEEHPDEVIVIDDVSTLLNSPVALNILLAALGRSPDDTGVRRVPYKRHGSPTQVVNFTGGIIFMSNVQIADGEVLNALKSRVNYMHYNPTNEQITALMKDIASKTYRSGGATLTAAECGKVFDYLVNECDRLKILPDVRLLVDKAFQDYLSFKLNETETHWKDLITSNLEEQLVDPTHQNRPATKKQEVAEERRIVEDVVKNHKSRKAQIAAWKAATKSDLHPSGKSLRTFYRRVKELGL